MTILVLAGFGATLLAVDDGVDTVGGMFALLSEAEDAEADATAETEGAVEAVAAAAAFDTSLLWAVCTAIRLLLLLYWMCD